jgi:hypothetical protein
MGFHSHICQKLRESSANVAVIKNLKRYVLLPADKSRPGVHTPKRERSGSEMLNPSDPGLPGKRLEKQGSSRNVSLPPEGRPSSGSH